MEWLVVTWLLVPAAVALTALAAAAASARRTREARVDVWRSVAVELGMRDVETVGAFFGESLLTGVVGRRRVTFERSLGREDASLTEVTVEGDSGITLLSQEKAGDPAAKPHDIEIGDEFFDAEVEVHGAPDRVRALLDADTRHVVRWMMRNRLYVPGRAPVFIRGTVSILHGHLRVLLRDDPMPPTPGELRELVEGLVAFAERFDCPADVAARLAATIEREPEWRARVYGLEVLATSHPTDAATISALRRALADEVPEIRLQAALGLGAEGRDTLLEIVRSRQAEDVISAHAIEALAANIPTDLAVSLLLEALRSRRLHIAGACVRVLGLHGGTAAAPLLAKVIALESGELAVSAARALGKSFTSEGEAALLAALQRGEPDVVVAALEALGRVGTVRAVMSIQEVAAEPDSPDDVRIAARQAVAAIQSRLPGASPGQVSIAESEAGQLSLADDDPRGRVSLEESS
jgi:hypothetical protein